MHFIAAETSGKQHLFFRRERPEMLLGADFLKAHRVLFAMSQRRFYFFYVGGEVFGSVPELLRRNDVAREQPAAAPDS